MTRETRAYVLGEIAAWVLGLVAVAIGILLTGCASAAHDAGAHAAEGMLDALNEPKYKQELSDASGTAGAGLRESLFDPTKITPKLDAIAAAEWPKLHLQLQGVPDDLLSPHARTLGTQFVDASLLHVNDHFATWSETAFGQPLQDKFDRFVEHARPQAVTLAHDMAAAAASGAAGAIKVSVSTEESKVKADVEWAGALLALALLVYAVESHRRAVVRLLDRMEHKS